MKATIVKKDKRLENRIIKTEGILSYDEDNLYPQRVINIVANSGIAKSCLRIYQKFICGVGAVDPDFYKAVINSEGMTVDKFIRYLAKQKGMFNGVAFHVNRDANLNITEINEVRYEDVRISTEFENKLVIYDNWERKKGKPFKKADFQYIDKYTSDKEIIAEQIAEAGGIENWHGQLFYPAEYTIAEFDAVLEDMITDGALKNFRLRSVESNFMASHIMVTGATDGEGDEAEQAQQDFKETLETFQGSENTAKILVIEKEREEDVFEIHKVEIQNFDGILEHTKNDVKDAIIESFLIPKPLLLRGSNSLGESKEIENSKEFYNDITADDRLQIEEILKEIFEQWYDQNICPSKDYSIIQIAVNKEITAEYFPYVTKNEIRKSIDLNEVEEAKADTKLLVEVLGVGGTQALTAVLADPVLSAEQKKATLKIVFGLSDDQASEMLQINQIP
jgi:hypothetical protein